MIDVREETTKAVKYALSVQKIAITDDAPCVDIVTRVIDIILSHYPGLGKHIAEDLSTWPYNKRNRRENTHRDNIEYGIYKVIAKYRVNLEIELVRYAGMEIPCGIHLINTDALGDAAKEFQKSIRDAQSRFRWPYPFSNINLAKQA